MQVAVWLTLAVVLLLYITLKISAVLPGRAKPASDLPGKTRPVDIQAFRNLLDPAEQDYLRRMLPAAQFRSVQRHRIMAALAYANAAARNAAILMIVAEAARGSADPGVAAAGLQMAEAATQLRLQLFTVRWRLCLKLALPAIDLGPASLADRYEATKYLAWRLGRLQNPSTAARVASAL